MTLTEDVISVDALLGAVQAPECGGIALFLGTVRNHHAGRRVEYLEYEAYPSLAQKQMLTIAEAAVSSYEVSRVAVAHRIGRLKIGEVSVAVAVAAAHRAPAFAACRAVIDALKETVPIWKREHGDGGEMWIEGPDLIPAKSGGISGNVEKSS
ncbi:MAG: molybdenum cofactor biosynthesis protein MoaE [Candidatus Xenobia bacterium]